MSHPSSVEYDAGCMILGNSGVGKSTLANVLAQGDCFVAAYQPNAVTQTTEHIVKLFNDVKVAIFNMPGLIENDPKAVERNKREIERAFTECPTSVPLYVFDCSTGGRIRDEDVVAFQALDEAFHFDRCALGFVCNQVPTGRPRDYEGQTTLCLQRLLGFSPRVTFVSKFEPSNKAARHQVFIQLKTLVNQCMPCDHRLQTPIELRTDKIEAMKKQVKAMQDSFNREKADLTDQINDLQHKYEELQNSPVKEEVHQHHYEEGGGGGGGLGGWLLEGFKKIVDVAVPIILKKF
eukprot:TRINITY_DN299_c0_g1_i2.p1 TRINITY_DN299_c0_g1~~TRINITY_DN299_c0_g1_i2.p1  ORF type:complete len:292 (+),score=70.87 TRINITY_DN299_c0_g1_i2:57-932(+)